MKLLKNIILALFITVLPLTINANSTSHPNNTTTALKFKKASKKKAHNVSSSSAKNHKVSKRKLKFKINLTDSVMQIATSKYNVGALVYVYNELNNKIVATSSVQSEITNINLSKENQDNYYVLITKDGNLFDKGKITK